MVRIPSRKQIPLQIGFSENDEGSLYADIVNTLKRKFEGLSHCGYTIACDGWVDNLQRSLLTFFICFEKGNYYIASLDLYNWTEQNAQVEAERAVVKNNSERIRSKRQRETIQEPLIAPYYMTGRDRRKRRRLNDDTAFSEESDASNSQV